MTSQKAGVLNQKEKIFCHLIVEGKTPIQAAKEAGYAKGAYSKQLMQKEKIQNYIQILYHQQQGSALEVAQNDEILQFLTSIMRGDEYEQRKDSVIKDRMRAAELLGKRLKLFDAKEEEQDTKIIIIDDISSKQGDGGEGFETKKHLSFTGDE